MLAPPRARRPVHPWAAPPESRRTHSALLGAPVIVVGLLVALLLTITTATTAASAASSTPTSTETLIAATTKALVNTERQAHRLVLVHMRGMLLTAARQHNLAMAHANSLSHQVRGEASLSTRILRTGYHYTWAGENIGWTSTMTTAGVLALERVMYNEVPPNDGHRLNILNWHFQNVGVDVYMDWAHHKVWLTVDFAHP